MLIARELPQVNVPEPYLQMDFNLARVNIEKAAYHGFAKAQVKMGAAYELCQLGCDFNPALSLHYNALAARQGEPEAEMAISKWFLCGHEGIFEKNDELAFTYAQRAAQSGLPTAEFALGYFYEVGIFVPADLKEARSWYAKAEASGNRDATGRIDSISRSKTLSRKDHQAVAINRIKSVRHVAHQRGNSFDPAGENLEMPDPSRLTLSDPPSAAAPYPDRGGPRVRPPGQQNYQMPDHRPSSAFGVNPNLRTNGPPQPYGSGPAPRTTSYGSNPGSYRPGPGSVPGSGPGTPVSAPPGPMSPQNMMGPNGTPRLDIGYSAPASQPGGRRPGRLEGAPPDRRPVRTPVGGAPPGGLASPRATASPRPSGSPSSANFPSQGGFPPRSESRQPSRGSAASAPSASTPGPRPPAQQQQQAPKPSAPPPGKGPKTFEEMGVPSAKTDNDCVCIHCCLPPFIHVLTLDDSW